MTLDEAIQHCKEKIKEQKSYNIECSLDHKQLMEWLIELRKLKAK